MVEEYTKNKKVKDTYFITLYDKNLFKDLQLPANPNSYLLWYKKTVDDYWGLTIKSYEPSTTSFTKQYTWKVTWVNDPTTNSLVPTKASQSFCTLISGELYDILFAIVNDNKKKIKK